MKAAQAAGKPRPRSSSHANAWCSRRRRTTPIGSCSANAPNSSAAASATRWPKPYEEVEDQEDEHLYHTKGWCRELWLESLGLKAVLPPPEERKHVKTAIGAALAEKESMTR